MCAINIFPFISYEWVYIHLCAEMSPLIKLKSVVYNSKYSALEIYGRGFVVVWLLSHVQLFATPWTAIYQASLFFTISQGLLKLMSIESVMPSNHLILCCPLLHPPSIIPSIRVLSIESVLHIKWPKYWSFSFNQHQSFQWIFRMISFRIDWFDLLAVQGILKRRI